VNFRTNVVQKGNLMCMYNLTEGCNWVGGGLLTGMHAMELITVPITLLEIKYMCLNAVMPNAGSYSFL